MELAIETRNASYMKITPTIGTKRHAIFEYLRLYPCSTNSEIADGLEWRINSVTGRVFELRALNLVVSGGKRVCMVSGEMCMTWKVNE